MFVLACTPHVEYVMHMVCLDLEGVLVPEIWIAFAQATGIDELRRTTRDEPDYDKLMKERIRILAEHGYTLQDIQAVIGTVSPLPGAKAFLDELRSRWQVIILSDTFAEFATPLMRMLGWPSLFCNSLVLAENGTITDYCLRQREGKRKAVAAFRSIGFSVVAAGDSYNDIGMLQEADSGILFRAPEAITREFPQFRAVFSYDELLRATEAATVPATGG